MVSNHWRMVKQQPWMTSGQNKSSTWYKKPGTSFHHPCMSVWLHRTFQNFENWPQQRCSDQVKTHWRPGIQWIFVELDGKWSSWHQQRTNLPQSRSLVSSLFNKYINGESSHLGIRSLIYEDDICVTAQGKDFSLCCNNPDGDFSNHQHTMRKTNQKPTQPAL